MTQKQYLAALKQLGLTPSGIATMKTLGLKMRAIQRMAAGDVRIPGPVAELLAHRIALKQLGLLEQVDAQIAGRKA